MKTKAIIIGVIFFLLGIITALFIKSASADTNQWVWYGAGDSDQQNIYTRRFTDGNINCYVSLSNSRTWTPPAISCVKK